MRKSLKLIAATLVVLLVTGGMAWGVGDQLQIRERDKLQDGSCQQVAGDQLQIRERDKLQDGSCQQVAGDQVRTRAKTSTQTRARVKS